MVSRTSSVNVSFEAWRDMAGDCYQLSLGSALIVIDRYKKSITVSMYGQKHTLSITPTSKLVYSRPGWCLEVQDNELKGWTEFKLVEQGCQAEPAPLPTSYIPTTTAVPPTFTRATNMLVDNREFTNDTWSMYGTANTGSVWDNGRVEGVKCYPQQLSQEQMNAITGPVRDKRLLLC